MFRTHCTHSAQAHTSWMQTIRLNVTNVFWGEDANNISLFFICACLFISLTFSRFMVRFRYLLLVFGELFSFRSASASARDKNKEDRVRRVEECQKLAIRLSAEGHAMKMRQFHSPLRNILHRKTVCLLQWNNAKSFPTIFVFFPRFFLSLWTIRHILCFLTKKRKMFIIL